MTYSIVLILAVFLIGIAVPECEAAPKKKGEIEKKDEGKSSGTDQDIFEQLSFDDEEDNFEDIDEETDNEVKQNSPIKNITTPEDGENGDGTENEDQQNDDIAEDTSNNVPAKKDSPQKQSPPPKVSEPKKQNSSSQDVRSVAKGSGQPVGSSAKKPSPAAKAAPKATPSKAPSKPLPKPSPASGTSKKQTSSAPPKTVKGKTNPPKKNSSTPKSTQARAVPVRKSTSQGTQKKVNPSTKKPLTTAARSTGKKPAATTRKSPSPPARTQRSASPLKTGSVRAQPARSRSAIAAPPARLKPNSGGDLEIRMRAAKLKENIEALSPLSFMAALAETEKRSPKVLKLVSSQLESVIKSLEGTPLKKYIEAINLFINLRNEY